MKKLFTILAVALIAFSCQKSAHEEISNPSKKPVSYIIPAGYSVPECQTPVEKTIFAGQTTNVGSVVVWNDETNVYVSYQTTGTYLLKKTHLYVGACSSIPVNNSGNPRIGLFPYTATHGTTGVSIYTYTIPRSSLPSGTCICVAAHAEIVAYNTSGQQVYSQTGWASGEQINDGGSWATKFTFCPDDCGGNR